MKAVRTLVDQIIRQSGPVGLQQAIRDVNEKVVERLPAGMAAACLFQAALTASRWNDYGLNNPLALGAVVSIGVILILTLLAQRRSLPASRAQPIWAATAIVVWLNILLYQAWEVESVGMFKPGIMAVTIGSSFLLFSRFWFALVMAVGLSIPTIGVVASRGSIETLLAFLLSAGAIWVAWTIRSNALAELLARRLAELGGAEQKRSFAASAMRTQTDAPQLSGQQSPGLLIYDLGQVVDCNDALLSLAGREGQDPASLDARELFVERDQRVVAAELAYPSENPAAVSIRTPSGEEVAVRLTASALDWQGRKLTLVSLSDVRSEIAWRIQAETDTLTGLPNRLRFNSEFVQEMQRFGANRQHGFGVAYLDLEDFKEINDAFGHAAGDETLRVVGRRLIDSIRPGDVAARLGGDEFAVIIRGVTQPETLKTTCARIRKAVERPIELGGGVLPCSISLGATLATSEDAEADTILERADRAMYADKQRRRPGPASD